MSVRYTNSPLSRNPIAIAAACIAALTGIVFSSDDVLPRPVTAENFAELKQNSPFRRTLELSDSLVLTGIAMIEGSAYATLFDSESKVSYVVSETVSPQGWQLVSVGGNDTNLESLTAKIQIDGGEVVSIRYQKIDFQSRRDGSPGSHGTNVRSTLSQEQIDDARRAARNPAEGFRGDGYRGTPPPEIMEKLRKITPEQREEIARRVMQMRNDGVDSDQRRRVYSEALDRAAKGRR